MSSSNTDMVLFPRDVVLDSGLRYDVAIGSVGYEARARHFLDAGVLAERLIGFEFTYLQSHDYAENRRAFEAAGAVLVQFGDEAYRVALWTILDETQPESILIDISSMPRWRIADSVAVVDEYLSTRQDAVCDFLYAPAQYSAEQFGKGRSADELYKVGPVRPQFAGAMRSSSIPIGAVLGLGFEENTALGAFELLEPRDAWAFLPTGIDERFDIKVSEANGYLLSLIPQSRHVSYEVSKPIEAYSMLESLCYARGVSNRMVLLPMGPKILALVAMILGSDRSSFRPAVWRVGVSQHQRAINVKPQGPVVLLRVEGREERSEE
jgi:hypothetical protein